MRNIILSIITIFLLYSCGENGDNPISPKINEEDTTEKNIKYWEEINGYYNITSYRIYDNRPQDTFKHEWENMYIGTDIEKNNLTDSVLFYIEPSKTNTFYGSWNDSTFTGYTEHINKDNPTSDDYIRSIETHYFPSNKNINITLKFNKTKFDVKNNKWEIVPDTTKFIVFWECEFIKN